MQTLFLCGIAGALGALSRLGITRLVQRLAGTNLPLATAAVNLLGCFLFGLLWGLLNDRFAVSAGVKTVIFTGFLGALTTFSTYAYENVGLLAEGRLSVALLNILGQNVLGFSLVALGLALARN
ncbi:fluoride efflux transporter CrcB [Megalodesulfovibrio paquesii]